MSKKSKNDDNQDKWQEFAQNQAEAPEEPIAEEDVFYEDEQPEPGLTFESRQELEAQLNALESKAEEYKAQALRAHAEMENLRRRVDRDVQNAHKYGTEKLLNDLLPVVDSLVRGLEGHADAQGDSKAMVDGMQMTLEMLLKTLQKHGVTVIDPAQGDAFNPEMHEAMSMQQVPGSEPNTVVQVLQKGFELNGRVLRAAMVIVAN